MLTELFKKPCGSLFSVELPHNSPMALNDVFIKKANGPLLLLPRKPLSVEFCTRTGIIANESDRLTLRFWHAQYVVLLMDDMSTCNPPGGWQPFYSSLNHGWSLLTAFTMDIMAPSPIAERPRHTSSISAISERSEIDMPHVKSMWNRDTDIWWSYQSIASHVASQNRGFGTISPSLLLNLSTLS